VLSLLLVSLLLPVYLLLLAFLLFFLRFCSWWLFVVVGVLLVVPIARVSVLLL
jgi:hypothetical protein